MTTQADTALTAFRARSYAEPKDFRKGVRALAERHSADYVLVDHVYELTFPDGSTLKLDRAEYLGAPAVPAPAGATPAPSSRPRNRTEGPRLSRPRAVEHSGPAIKVERYAELVREALAKSPMTEVRIKPTISQTNTYFAFSISAAASRGMPVIDFMAQVTGFLAKYYEAPEAWGMANGLLYFGPLKSRG